MIRFLLPWVLLSTSAMAAEQAGDLPRLAQELRDKGLDASEVRAALAAAQSAQLPAKDAAMVLKESVEPVTEHGPIENFGSFVKAKLDSGLRGKDLSSAIRSEHKKRGIGGKPKPGQGKNPNGKDPNGKNPNGKDPNGKDPSGKKPSSSPKPTGTVGKKPPPKPTPVSGRRPSLRRCLHVQHRRIRAHRVAAR